MTKLMAMAIDPNSGNRSESISSLPAEQSAQYGTSSNCNQCKDIRHFSKSCRHVCASHVDVDASKTLESSALAETGKCNYSKKPDITTTYSFDVSSKCDTGIIPLTLGSRRSHEFSSSASPQSSSASFDERFRFSLTTLANFINAQTFLEFSMGILILLHAIVLGFWINLYHMIQNSMVHTFSWLTLLSPMGVYYQFQNCGMDSILKCDVTHSPPFIPILGIFLGSLQLFNSVIFFGCKSCRKVFLIYLKQSVFLECLFVIFSGISSGVLLKNKLYKLKETMTQEMTVLKGRNWTNESESMRWKSTQSTLECCGLTGVSDWQSLQFHGKENEKDFVPISCFDLKLKHSGAVMWQRGCLDLEYSTVLFYGKYQVILLITGLIGTIGIYLVARRFVYKIKEIINIKKKKMENVPSHRVFIRQGSNFTAFGGQGRNHHVIRKDNILMETTGAVASSTGINENVISLEILDYSDSDKINVTRESDRIIIIVTKHGILRGKAVITAKMEQDLEKIQVKQTGFGLIITV